MVQELRGGEMNYGRLDSDSPILTPDSKGRQTVGDFWSWAYSNILTNITRGLFAEFLVGMALEAVEGSRTEWDSYDLCYGGAHIEVKSSAYLQSWPQDKTSKIGWSISPSTYRYAEMDEDQDDQEPPADCYVFCVYTEKKDRNPAIVLDSEKWRFYVVPTTVIRKELWHQKTVVESSIKSLVGEPVRYSHLRERVEEALGRG
jgi:hypothetical protein